MRILPEGTQKIILIEDEFIIRPDEHVEIPTDTVDIMGHSRMVNDPDQPQKVWIETWAEVRYR